MLFTLIKVLLLPAGVRRVCSQPAGSTASPTAPTAPVCRGWVPFRAPSGHVMLIGMNE